MALRLRTIVIDATDPTALTRFWAEALGREVVATGHDEFTLLRDPSRRDPKLLIQKVPERPAGHKNRVHIDLYAPDPSAEAARLERAGASVKEKHEERGDMWIWMTDPDGNDFCIVRSDDA